MAKKNSKDQIEYVYVLDVNGTPLMPTTRKAKVRKMLKSGKAKIVEHHPFTIQLLYKSTGIVQDLSFCIDPGRENIGLAVINDNGTCYMRSIIRTRNKDVTKLMAERKKHRQMSRHGERQRRQRRALKNNTFHKPIEKERTLPQCEKPITNKYIQNTEARFCNRKRPEGWLTPTANHLLQTFDNTINLIEKYLPIKKCAIEVNKFDIARLKNPNIKGKLYQNGQLKGFKNVDDAVYAQQKGKCLFCNKDIEEYHHCVPVSEGGSDTLGNKAGLCKSHHIKVHTDTKWQEKLKTKKEGIEKEFGGLSIINQIMPRLIELLNDHFKGQVYSCFGYDTQDIRNTYNIPKDHDLDAYCIGLATICISPNINYDIKNTYEILQFRRHNRQIIHAQRERVYKLNGKIVAKNRHKRIGQTNIDSLHDWYIKQKQQYGKKEARKQQSQLKVLKSKRVYRTNSSLKPGTVILYNGERHIVSGTKNKGLYVLFKDTGSQYFKIKECKIIKRRKGLVFL